MLPVEDDSTVRTFHLRTKNLPLCSAWEISGAKCEGLGVALGTHVLIYFQLYVIGGRIGRSVAGGSPGGGPVAAMTKTNSHAHQGLRLI